MRHAVDTVVSLTLAFAVQADDTPQLAKSFLA